MLPRLLMRTIKNRSPEMRRESRPGVPPGYSFVLIVTLLIGCTPAGPRALLQGKRLIEQGNYSKAMEQLSTASSLLPTNAQAWNYLGLACHYGGHSADAEKAYQRALLLDRDLSEAHYNLGCLWLEQNKTNAAKNELTAYSLRRPNSIEGLLKLGMAQLRSRDLGGAEKSFNEAFRLSPQNPQALNGLGLVRYYRGRAGDAAQLFSGACKQQPNFAPAVLNLAIVAQQSLKDRPLALQKYREYLALKPPARNAEAVNGLIRQLELELSPAPRPAPTNLPPAVSSNHNSANAAVTNLPHSTVAPNVETVTT